MFNRIKSIFFTSPLGTLSFEVERRVLLAFDLANFPFEYYNGVMFCLDYSLPEGVNGVFRPSLKHCVFVNSDLPWHEMACIIAHELVHRRDYLESPVFYRLCSLPIVNRFYLEPQAVVWEDKIREVCSNHLEMILKS